MIGWRGGVCLFEHERIGVLKARVQQKDIGAWCAAFGSLSGVLGQPQ